MLQFDGQLRVFPREDVRPDLFRRVNAGAGKQRRGVFFGEQRFYRNLQVMEIVFDQDAVELRRIRQHVRDQRPHIGEFFLQRRVVIGALDLIPLFAQPAGAFRIAGRRGKGAQLRGGEQARFVCAHPRNGKGIIGILHAGHPFAFVSNRSDAARACSSCEKALNSALNVQFCSISPYFRIKPSSMFTGIGLTLTP